MRSSSFEPMFPGSDWNPRTLYQVNNRTPSKNNARKRKREKKKFGRCYVGGEGINSDNIKKADVYVT